MDLDTEKQIFIRLDYTDMRKRRAALQPSYNNYSPKARSMIAILCSVAK